jgi:hypothetical protein
MANTQVIIKIAGKQKSVSFSTPIIAGGFVKDASTKFGEKFQFVGALVPGAGDRPDQCPKCKSTDVFYTRSDGQQLDLMNPSTFDKADVVNCSHCEHKWPFKIVFNENEIQQGNVDKRKEEVEQAWNSEPHKAAEEEKTASDIGSGVQVGQQWKDNEFGTIFTVGFVDESSDVALLLDQNGKESMTVLDSFGKYLQPLKQAGTKKTAAFSMMIPGQVVSEFKPELLDSLYGQPTDSHTDTQNVDALSSQLEGALDTGILSMVPTSSGNSGMGLGNAGKGDPFRKEDDIRGPLFMEEYYANYDQAPAINVLAKKAAKGEELAQFKLFMRRVMMECAASFLAIIKTTSHFLLNKVPGVGILRLEGVEQPPNVSFNTTDTGSRIRYLLEKLTDSEIQDGINGASCQSAVWNESPDGGFVIECFCRANALDRDTLELEYTYVLGSKGI